MKAIDFQEFVKAKKAEILTATLSSKSSTNKKKNIKLEAQTKKGRKTTVKP